MDADVTVTANWLFWFAAIPTFLSAFVMYRIGYVLGLTDGRKGK